MPDQDDRPAIAAAVLCRDLCHDRVGLGMVVDARGDAALCDLRRQLVHAEREDVHEPAQQKTWGRDGASCSFAAAGWAAAGVSIKAVRQVRVSAAASRRFPPAGAGDRLFDVFDVFDAFDVLALRASDIASLHATRA